MCLVTWGLHVRIYLKSLCRDLGKLGHLQKSKGQYMKWCPEESLKDARLELVYPQGLQHQVLGHHHNSVIALSRFTCEGLIKEPLLAIMVQSYPQFKASTISHLRNPHINACFILLLLYRLIYRVSLRPSLGVLVLCIIYSGAFIMCNCSVDIKRSYNYWTCRILVF